MAKTITESMKDLTVFERNNIIDVAKIADENRIRIKRKLQHINNYLYVRNTQIKALSNKLQNYLSTNNFSNKLDGFDSIGKRYMMNNDDFGNTLATIKGVLYDEVKKGELYSKENAEVVKLYASISYYLVTNLPAFKTNLDKITGYTG